ncbi:hypothetical protein M407DRAFT_224543, partial [Tulasnella calospora MUT 4182]
LDLGDRFSMVFFAVGASVILFIIYIWCFFSTIPGLVWIWRLTKGRRSGGLGLVNAMNPRLFDNLTTVQADAAKEKLSAPPDPSEYQARKFSLDVAKMLLLISSLMYERSTDDTIEAIKNIKAHINPFNLSITKSTSSLAGDVVNIERSSRSKIYKWTRDHGIQYEPVSELASLGQAYASVFWDPKSNCIVVAFKGTDPRSFEEWTTDFTASFDRAHDHIPGFNMVHRGFKEVSFGYGASGNARPDSPLASIVGAIKIVSEGLSRDLAPDTKINVWFTGHSLGTALATLAYSKALVSSKDLPDNVILRDAYLFATPITVDKATRHHFNDKMFAKDSDVPRTMWRVTNRNDAVATALPDWGDDDKRVLSENNLLGFSHLGIEIFMKTGPHASQVKGNQVKTYGKFEVHITSKFTQEEIIAQRDFAEKNNWTSGKLCSLFSLSLFLGTFSPTLLSTYVTSHDVYCRGQR